MRRPIHEIKVAKDASWATVHTRVDHIYRDFLEEIDLAPKTEEAAFEAHLKMIIWGVLYVEALLNFKLYELTRSEFSDEAVVNTYWSLTKQARIDDKLDFVFEYGHIKSTTVRENRQTFTRMVEERNRLVHFKDVPTEFAFSTLRAKLEINAPLQKWFDNAPSPKIVSDLLATSLEDRKKVFLTLGGLLERVRARRG
jgi:hypothetical protein